MASFRTVPRYFLLPPLHARFGDHTVSVVDLSLKGARIEVPQPLPLGARFQLSIETHRGAIELAATVLWSEIDELSLTEGPDRYLAGMVFDDSSAVIGELIERLLKSNLAIPIEDARSSDRFRITAQLTGTFGEVAPVGVIDLSVRGARIALPQFIRFGTNSPLRFQVDGETGLVDVDATVMWCLGASHEGFEAGLKIDGHEERLRIAIHRLCMRDEARIDLHSLRRRFDAMRALSHQYQALRAS
jgi:PilZ domain-containing protein